MTENRPQSLDKPLSPTSWVQLHQLLLGLDSTSSSSTFCLTLGALPTPTPPLDLAVLGLLWVPGSPEGAAAGAWTKKARQPEFRTWS